MAIHSRVNKDVSEKRFNEISRFILEEMVEYTTLSDIQMFLREAINANLGTENGVDVEILYVYYVKDKILRKFIESINEDTLSFKISLLTKKYGTAARVMNSQKGIMGPGEFDMWLEMEFTSIIKSYNTQTDISFSRFASNWLIKAMNSIEAHHNEHAIMH